MMNFLKIAFRIQTRYKWFTLINVTGLALGMLCSLVIFLYVHFHFSTDTHHRNAGNLYRVVLDIHTPEGTIEYEEGTSLPMAAALARDYSQVERTAFCMAFYSAPTITIHQGMSTNRYKEASGVAYADNQFIELFAPHFIEGDARTALSQPNSAVLSARQAIKYFGTTHATGKTLNINNKADLVVTGVTADRQKNSDLTFDILVSLPTLKVINPRYQTENFTWIGSNNWTFIKLRNGNTTLEEQLPAFVKKY
jgi:putative ABC transport system permease protein